MKFNGQTRSFVKLVQGDLLALCDADLSYIIDRWIRESASSELSLDVAEETRLALGYTRTLANPKPPLSFLVLDAESEGSAPWQAPSPHHLRTLLTAMDVDAFVRHVINCAFKSLHTTHPEWEEGITFNAHLANYLRQLKDGSANRNQRARHGTSPFQSHL